MMFSACSITILNCSFTTVKREFTNAHSFQEQSKISSARSLLDDKAVTCRHHFIRHFFVLHFVRHDDHHRIFSDV